MRSAIDRDAILNSEKVDNLDIIKELGIVYFKVFCISYTDRLNTELFENCS